MVRLYEFLGFTPAPTTQATPRPITAPVVRCCTEKPVCETCGTEIGWEAYVTCTRCDYTTYKELAALGHDLADATCTKPSICKRGCGHTEGKALGHKFGPWVTIEEPTEKEGGRKKRICSVCGHKTSKYVKPLSEDGITVIIHGGKYESESNPNTGAPAESVSVICAMALLAGMAMVIEKIKK